MPTSRPRKADVGQGGKWTLLFRAAPSLMDLAWSHLTMGLVGGLLDPNDEVTGVVASNRPKISRIQLWTRRKGKTDADAESLDALGKRIYESLDFSGRDLDHFSMEFQVCRDDNAFLVLI